MTETNEYGETVLKTAGVRAQCLTCSKTFKYRGDLRGEGSTHQKRIPNKEFKKY